MDMTKTEQIIEALKTAGCTEVVSKSHKYRQFSIPGSEKYYFVGKAGSLRKGRISTQTLCVANVVPLLIAGELTASNGALRRKG